MYSRSIFTSWSCSYGREMYKKEFRGEYNSVAKYKVKAAVWSPKEVEAKADTNVSEYYTLPAIYFCVI